MTYFNIYSIRRSGTHAIKNWLIDSMGNNVKDFNDIYRKKQFKKVSRFVNRSRNNERSYDVIASFEDKDPRDPNFINLLNILPKSDQDILIIRDPLNLFASYIKRGFLSRRSNQKQIIEPNTDYLDRIINLYIYYYSSEKYYKINYNKWFLQDSYKDKVCKDLSLKRNDRRINMVPRNGNGSSFDKRAYNGSASEMDVLNRWQSMKNNKFFKQVMLNNEINSISKEFKIEY